LGGCAGAFFLRKIATPSTRGAVVDFRIGDDGVPSKLGRWGETTLLAQEVVDL
jgi:hypothetical protein